MRYFSNHLSSVPNDRHIVLYVSTVFPNLFLVRVGMQL